MARRLRIQFAGARYHVINRGNLRHDVFATGGAIASFVRTLQAAVGRFQWRLHAFVVMRNHFHLALATPELNLVAGMHWLQSTFAVRLTRFHRQHGHVFQGRYRSLVIEDDAHLARVCDYIHLNPVRAGVLAVEQLRDYRASSLWYWLRGRSRGWLDGEGWWAEAGLRGAEDPWARYLQRLVGLTQPEVADERTERGAFSRGWAIGTRILRGQGSAGCTGCRGMGAFLRLAAFRVIRRLLNGGPGWKLVSAPRHPSFPVGASQTHRALA